MALACGEYHSITVDDAGDVWAFGDNTYGQCGIDTNGEDIIIPHKVECLDNIIAVSAAGYHSSCIDMNGNLYIFGYNGHLGHGYKKNSGVPTRVQGIDNVVAVACGTSHTICLTSNNGIFAFGSNNCGQLGIGSSYANTPVVSRCLIQENVKEIACGGAHSVFLCYNGDVWMCGNNMNGELGLGNTKLRYTPEKHPTLKNIVLISCGINSTVVMNSDNQIYSFGSNLYGQLCLNDNQNRYYPELVTFPEEIQVVSCGPRYTVIVDVSNGIWIFGYSQLPGGKLEEYHYAVKYNQPKNISLLATGGYHCLLKTITNEIWGMGYNQRGQLLFHERRTILMSKLPENYNHLIGIPIERFKSRAKSARK